MDGLSRAALARMPLAESVLAVWRWVADERFLEAVYERHRGRGYERVLRFPVLVSLLADALLVRDGSGREAFECGRDEGLLPVSIQAAYGKLRRIPPPLSQAFLAETAERLRSLWPAGTQRELPPCVDEFDVFVLDGKTVKDVQKRLKPLRNVAGGVVGGKALVALELRTGLALGMRTHLDGDASELEFIPELLAEVRSRSRNRRLWMGDRAFSYLEHVLSLGVAPDEFLVRRRSNVTFEPDLGHSARSEKEAGGRRFREEWGRLRRRREKRTLAVRQITLSLPKGEELILLTSLLDADRYPAAQLLELYRARWRIEQVFQEITQVFGLARLIGHSPEASLFQLAFCLLLYNTLQLVRACLARQRKLPVDRISNHKLFRDLHRQLSAWTLFLGPALTRALHLPPPTAAGTAQWLEQRLHRAWSRRWIKAPPQTRKPKPPPSGRGQHTSAQRILDQQHAKSGTVDQPAPGQA